jgi:hypothetical protein
VQQRLTRLAADPCCGGVLLGKTDMLLLRCMLHTKV